MRLQPSRITEPPNPAGSRHEQRSNQGPREGSERQSQRREVAGKVFGNQTEEVKGKVEKNLGKVQAGYGTRRTRSTTVELQRCTTTRTPSRSSAVCSAVGSVTSRSPSALTQPPTACVWDNAVSANAARDSRQVPEDDGSASKHAHDARALRGQFSAAGSDRRLDRSRSDLHLRLSGPGNRPRVVMVFR
jgi:hypothetical protein